MDSPGGRFSSVSVPSHGTAHSVADSVGAGRDGLFERLAEWGWDIEPGDTHDRRAQRLEAMLSHDGRKFRSYTATQISLIGYHEPSRSTDGC